MVKVQGPMMSFDASGTLGKVATFAKWKGRNYVRTRVIPANPRSASQISVRAMMKFLSQNWTNLSDALQAGWEDRAAITNISPFNAFVAYNMSAWGIADRPTQYLPRGAQKDAAVISDLTVTAQPRANLVSVTISDDKENWAVGVFRRIDESPLVARSRLVQVLLAEDVDTYTWLDTPLTVGEDYYYTAEPWSINGRVRTYTGPEIGTPLA